MIDMIILLEFIIIQAEALELARAKIQVLQARIQAADDWIHNLEIALNEPECAGGSYLAGVCGLKQIDKQDRVLIVDKMA